MATFRLARRLRAERAVDSMSDGQFAVLAGPQDPRTAHPRRARRPRARLVAVDEPHGQLPRRSPATCARTPTRSTAGKVNISLTDDGRDGRRRDRAPPRCLGRGGARRAHPGAARDRSLRPPRSCRRWRPDERDVPLLLGVQLPRLVHRRARLEHRRMDADDGPQLGRPDRAHRQRRRRDGHHDGAAVRSAAAARRRDRLGRRPIRPPQAAHGHPGAAARCSAS